MHFKNKKKIVRNVARLNEKWIWEVIIVTGLHYVNSGEQLSQKIL